MNQVVDVAIIGASLAGSALAQLLGQAKISVALIDKETFPRNKACGEGLSVTGLAALKRMGLLGNEELSAALLSQSSSNFAGYRIHNNGRAVNLSNPGSSGRGIPRVVLDQHVLRVAALNESVQLFEGQAVNAICSELATERVYALKLSGGETVKARFVVLACGGTSRLFSDLKIQSLVRKPSRFGVSATWKGKLAEPLDRIEIFLERGFEALITPTGAGLVNVSVLIHSDHSSGNKFNQQQVDSVMSSALKEINFIGTRISKPEGRVVRSGRRFAPKGSLVALIGDAAEQLDPVGGMGMTHALMSAELLAKQLVPCFRQARSAKQLQLALVRYNREREKMARPLRAFTCAVYTMLTKFPAPFMRMPRLSALIGPILTKGVHRISPKMIGVSAVQKSQSWTVSSTHFVLSVVGAFL